MWARSASSLASALVVLGWTALAAAAPLEEALMPMDRYTTEKAKGLATVHGHRLRQIYDRVHQCRPWLEVQKAGLGFTRAVGRPGDERYLNIWVWVDQKITPEFRALPTDRRHSAMFSRHGVDLFRHLLQDAAIGDDPALHGYSVILTWIKPDGTVNGEERAETLGVFADKATVRAFLARRIDAHEFVRRATVVAFDGKERLARLGLEVWEDNFTKSAATC